MLICRISNLYNSPTLVATKYNLLFGMGNPFNNKASIICDIILSNHLDMLAVTETWLCSGVNTSIADILNSLHDFSLAGPKSHRTRGRDSNLHP